MSLRMNRLLLAAVLALLSSPLLAQGPSADWRTIETAHFRVHFPAEYEAWAARAASRLESIRAAVVAEVGFSPTVVTDVLVMNPVAESNGMALPLLDNPRMVFWTEPPSPDQQIGEYSDWIDLLAVHEVAHLVHLLRPSRNPMQRVVERVVPISPITFRGPRWVLEGYATVVEGRLTGAGRPSSSIRAAIVRKWAQAGRLPSYGQLNSNQEFAGMSMAYLMGSAYLEWLEQRSGEGSLRKLWARMTARQRRTFDQAFEGVFGESPRRLYGRFVSELTANANDVDRNATLREGELWQETSRASGDPAISPDGKRIAVIVRQRNKPSKLVLWSTAPPAEEEERFAKRMRRILDRDPEDVPPVAAKPLPRKPLRSYIAPDGGDLESPRWTADGASVIYTHRQPDPEGFLHHDLFRWSPETGESERLTRLADVSNADPSPDGRFAVGVRNRHGFSQLVRVSLTDGTIAPVNEPSLDRVYTHPRVSPDGKRIVFAAHGDGAWRLFVRELDGGSERVVPIEQGSVATPEWSKDGAIYATVLARGFVEIHRFGETMQQITRSSGGSFQPAPAPDGRLFFMGLEPDGYVVRVLDTATLTPLPSAAMTYDRPLVPALPPTPPKPTVFASEEVTSRPYGIGRQEPDWLLSQNIARGARALELGLRLGDVVGKLDVLAIASIGDERGPVGATVAAAWRGLPITLEAQLFQFEEEPRTIIDSERRGLELRGSWSARAPRRTLALSGGALVSRVRATGGDDWLSRNSSFVNGALRVHQLLGATRFEEELRLGGESGETDGDAWYALRGALQLGVKGGGYAFRVRHDRRSTHDAPTSIDLLALGGLPSSIVPRSAFSTRVFDPALPTGTLISDRYEGVRAEATIPLLPMTLFFQRHRLRDDSLRVVGLEWTANSDPIPLGKLPAFDFTLGVAKVLDAPLKDRTSWWIGLRWRP